MADALVLAGAVLKGPFGAGVLSVFSDPETSRRMQLDVRRVLGASAGSLNAAYYAAAVHAGEEAGAGDRLAQIWIHEATLLNSFAPSLKGVLARRGLSSMRKLRKIMEKNLKPAPSRRPVRLGLVAANLDGFRTTIGGSPATVHEHIFWFNGGDLSTRAGVDHLFDVISASAAFPGVFEPVTLRFHGKSSGYVDGGAVNNTPIQQALGNPPDIDRVFLVSPTPRVERSQGELRGLAYATQLAEILIEERLTRDLREAATQNAGIALLERLIPNEQERAKVMEAVGWKGRRVVEILEIRPPSPLPGTAFSGWVSQSLREEYVAEGRKAAERFVEHYLRSGESELARASKTNGG